MEVCCVICKESSPETVVVGNKGRQTLISSSLERGDGSHKSFQEAAELRIHVDCRKRYTRRSSIASAKRKSLCLEEDNELPQLWSSVAKTFDIKNACMFCSNSILQESKREYCRRRAVSNVETLEFQTTILNRAKERCDKWGEEVLERVQHACDLVAAEAKYHRQCAQSFLKPQSNKSKPDADLRADAFKKLCEFIDDDDECQYSVQDLSDHMSMYLDGNEGYSIKHLKTKLKEHYGEDIVITSLNGKSSIVSFKDDAHRILHERRITDKVLNAATQSDRIIDMAASIILDDIRMSVYDCDEYTTMEAQKMAAR